MIDVFLAQSKMQRTSIACHTVSVTKFEELADHSQDSFYGEPTNSEESLPQLLKGDISRLKQILINLVKNAFKFTKNGYVKIVAAYDYDAQLLKVHVVDNGKGINKKNIKTIFEAFGKLKRTAQMNSEGIGLGLMVC